MIEDSNVLLLNINNKFQDITYELNTYFTANLLGINLTKPCNLYLAPKLIFK